MGEWYWIGLCAGLGVSCGVLAAALLGWARVGLLAAITLGAAAGAAIGFGLENWDEALGGGLGGAAGGFGAATIVRGCDSGSLEELEADVERLADAAREGTLAPEELRGSTFSVTSAGKLGGLLVTPLVNYPEVGILGLHRIGERPVVRDGEIVVRRIGNVSVTFDHRVVDGARAAAFTLRIIEQLQA